MKKILGVVFAATVVLAPYGIARLIGSDLRLEFLHRFEKFYFSEDDTEQFFDEYLPKTSRVLRSSFLDDFDNLIIKATNMIKNEIDVDEISILSADYMADLRRKYASDIAFAPDAMNRTILFDQVDIISYIYKTLGWEKCNAYVMNGYYAIINEERLHNDDYFYRKFDEASANLFSALAEGRINKDTPKNENDTENVNRMNEKNFAYYLLENGFSYDDFAIVDRLDLSEPILCPTILRYLGLLAIAPGQSAAAIRADVVAEIVKN